MTLVPREGWNRLVQAEAWDVAPLFQKPPTDANFDHRMPQEQPQQRHYDIGFSETDAEIGFEPKSCAITFP